MSTDTVQETRKTLQEARKRNTTLFHRDTFEAARQYREEHQDLLRGYARLRLAEEKDKIPGEVQTYTSDGAFEIQAFAFLNDQPVLCGHATAHPYTDEDVYDPAENVLHWQSILAYPVDLEHDLQLGDGELVTSGRGIGDALRQELYAEAAEHAYDYIRAEVMDLQNGAWVDTLRGDGFTFTEEHEEDVLPVYMHKPVSRQVT